MEQEYDLMPFENMVASYLDGKWRLSTLARRTSVPLPSLRQFLRFEGWIDQADRITVSAPGTYHLQAITLFIANHDKNTPPAGRRAFRPARNPTTNTSIPFL